MSLPLQGISCFDYSHQLDLLVTGSADHVVRFWDPYVTARPTAIFTHHRTPLVDVLIHGELGVVFSFSRDAVSQTNYTVVTVHVSIMQ